MFNLYFETASLTIFELYCWIKDFKLKTFGEFLLFIFGLLEPGVVEIICCF